MKFIKSNLFCGIVVAALPAVTGQTIFNTYPSRMTGQPTLQQTTVTSTAANLVEGRELNVPQAIALDTTATPPIVYVADSFNNRVLAWKNEASFKTGDPADLVIGQRDLLSTAFNGPGTSLSTGLYYPGGVAVDKSGNLYVADTGNNRILRYPSPFKQTSQLLPVDLIIGQKDPTGKNPNEGNSSASAKTLYLSSSPPPPIGMVFDGSGNLYVSDVYNNRVLRYPASVLGATPTNEPAADVVIGQFDFVTNKLPPTFVRNQKSILDGPAGLAFSPDGRLYVTDTASRVLVYTPPFQTVGMSADRVMGVVVPVSGGPQPPTISESTLLGPNGVFFVGNNPYVIDSFNHRILEYDPYSQWPAESATCGNYTCYSPPAKKVFGQPDFVSSSANAGNAQPSATTYAAPFAAVVVGTDVLLVDTGNNRVLDIPLAGDVLLPATRILGQLDFKYNSVNLIEGREFNFVQTQAPGGSIAIDNVSSVPHMYVADPGNNRVLGFRDGRNVQPGQKADLVVGQPDFFTSLANYPTGLATSVNSSCLFSPEGVAVDSNGDLWVADSGNGRVMRFPRPFDQGSVFLQTANRVIGQVSFFIKQLDVSSQNMNFPIGIAFTTKGDLVVSDSGFNRVLLFKKPGGDFSDGPIANFVIGQRDFLSTGTSELNAPRGIALDSSDRLYLTDALNNRVVVYSSLTQLTGNDPASVLVLTGATPTDPFASPRGVAVDPATSEIWVADTNRNRVVRFPQFDTISLNPTNNLIIPDFQPVGVTLDAKGNPISAEGINRIAFFYRSIGLNCDAPGSPLFCAGNAANYFYRFAPGMLTTIKPSHNSSFGSQTATFTGFPVPKTLGDVQVLVGGVPSVLTYVSASQINFMIPTSTPVGPNLVEFQVVKASTNELLASYLYKIDQFSPGLFTSDSEGPIGSGALAVVNQDNSINGGSHPAKAGSVISLYCTGQGVIPGEPADDQPAPNSLVSTAIKPRVFIGNIEASSSIQYSGLAPGEITGLWQINVVVPANIAPGTANVVIQMADVGSSQDPSSGKFFFSTIRVTQ